MHIMYGEGYYREVAEQLGLVNLTPANSMGDPKIHFTPNTTGKASKELVSFYRSLIGSMLFPSRMWRPDSANRVRALAAFTNNPSFEHVDAAIQVLRYCIRTETFGIKFSKPKLKVPTHLMSNNPGDVQLEVMLMTDADWNREFDRKSVSGTRMRVCTVMEMEHGLRTGEWPDFNFFSWRSKKQADLVADSTVSAETAAACVGVRDLMWQRNVFQEIGVLARNSRGVLLSDNAGLVVNLHNNKITTSMRHYARNVAFLCHEVESSRLEPRWIGSRQKWAMRILRIQPLTTSCYVQPQSASFFIRSPSIVLVHVQYLSRDDSQLPVCT
jgi:hypothetical protein